MTVPFKMQRGMSLIEVLVAILIFSVGVLGLVAVQVKATQVSQDAEDRGRAAVLANEVISLMWTNHTAALSSAVLTTWQAEVGYTTTPTAYGLPSGTGTIATAANANGVNVTTITIQWQEPSHKTTTGAPLLSQYITSVVIN